MRWSIALLLAAAPLVLAPASAAAQGCPPGFQLHAVDDHDHEHGEHRHVGLAMEAADRNGNGLICVKHVTPDGAIHVHIDDLPA
jgi:hypothetical protein